MLAGPPQGLPLDSGQAFELVIKTVVHPMLRLRLRVTTVTLSCLQGKLDKCSRKVCFLNLRDQDWIVPS